MKCCFITLHTTQLMKWINPRDSLHLLPTLLPIIRIQTRPPPCPAISMVSSLLFPPSSYYSTLHQNSSLISFSPSRPAASQYYISTTLTKHFKRNHFRCNNTFLDNISDLLLDNNLDHTLSVSPVFQSGYAQFQRLSQELPDTEKWGFLVFGGIVWLYLTARPGVLIGAIDAYILAPLQKGIDILLGNRSLSRTNFIIQNKLGEGSFGVVYSGLLVPKNVSVQETTRKRGNRTSLDKDSRFKDKVILKKVNSFTSSKLQFKLLWFC